MAIVSGEIKLYRPTTSDDSGSNGGRISATPITGSIFPSAQNTERINGSTKYRKAFYKIENEDDLSLINPQFFMFQNTSGNDSVVAFNGTQRDTQSTIAPTRFYGTALTVGTHNTGVSLINIVQESTVTLFQTGDMAVITDKADIDSENGTIEYFDVGNVSQNGSTVTLTADNYVTLNAYTQNSKVSSVIELDDFAATVSNKVVTSSAGTCDSAFILVNSFGTIEQDWTVTFTSATSFSVVGDTVGLIGTGDRSTEFTGDNPNFTKPYFIIQVAGWGGTFQTNDTVTFKTHPCAQGIWFKRVIPQNTQATSSNTFKFCLIGDSDDV